MVYLIIPDAAVSIINVNLGIKLGMTTTDKFGRYYVMLPSADYLVKVEVKYQGKTAISDVKKITRDHAIVNFDIGI